MNSLRDATDEYLTIRRQLGFKLVSAGYQLQNFVKFMESQGAEYITTNLSLQWAAQPADVMPRYLAQRLDAVRQFARYRAVTDPRTDIPGADLLSRHAQKVKPYHYTDREIIQLMQAAVSLPPREGLNKYSLKYIIGLLAATGMRIGEILNLTDQDIDYEQSLIVVRESKFGKMRLVPVHHSTISALKQYVKHRRALLELKTFPRFFVSKTGNALPASTVRQKFKSLCCQIGIRKTTDSHGPRLHDFRHRFATETLLQWYRSGTDTEQRLPALTTFLGHSRLENTYWYFSFSPELMGHVVKRLENYGR
jgi:site-specific recombinase XerD